MRPTICACAQLLLEADVSSCNDSRRLFIRSWTDKTLQWFNESNRQLTMNFHILDWLEETYRMTPFLLCYQMLAKKAYYLIFIHKDVARWVQAFYSDYASRFIISFGQLYFLLSNLFGYNRQIPSSVNNSCDFRQKWYWTLCKCHTRTPEYLSHR